ncbi:MAG: class I SAM-dependent methyltransferase [Pseudomonadota bacterium]|nr:class I SAM-dependent methyltransferase [Pseudomonadota bacterium]
MLDEKRYNEIVELTRSIQGWAHASSLVALYDLALQTPNGSMLVELGSWKGLSAAWMGTALKDRGHGRLFAVDTWSGTTTEPGHAELLAGYGPDQLYQEFLGNMQRLGLQDTVVPIRSNTLSAARQWQHGTSISLLYIDASHEYADVRADFEHWAPNVVDGGVIVFDDVPSWPGPTRLVTELPSWYRWVRATPNQGIVVKMPAR